MKKIGIFTACFVILSSFGLSAQGMWDFSGQIRHRSEIDQKDFNSDTNSNVFHLLRSRFAARYLNDDVTVYLQLQDSRFFGEAIEAPFDGSAENFDLHQGYVLLSDMFGKPFDLKIGRMEPKYGNERLIGAVGWHNIGRSFDGFAGTYRGARFSVELFNYKIAEHLQPGDKDDVNLFGAYGRYNPKDSYTVQPYFLFDRQKTIEMDRFTAGVYVSGETDAFFHRTELAYQFGDFNDNTISAYLAAITAGYRFPGVARSPEIAIGVDFLSGSDPDSDDYTRFNTLYATNHKFYGYMDYFLSIPMDTGGMGLIDYHLSGGIDVLQDTRLSAAYHIFKSDDELRRTGGQTLEGFGRELDITVSHAYSDIVTFTGGGSVFFPGNLFELSRGEDTATWFYLMTTVNLR